jgi:hypothetical protein
MVVNPTLLDTTVRRIISDSNYNEGRVSFSNTGITGNWAGTASGTWSSTIVTNKWYHVAFTHCERINGTYRCELYVDGILRFSATSTSTDSFYGPDNRLTIGYLFQGHLADLTIYDRELTASEVNLLKDTRSNLYT